jgi:ATP-dependent Clp protease adaptor protein ClpS
VTGRSNLDDGWAIAKGCSLILTGNAYLIEVWDQTGSQRERVAMSEGDDRRGGGGGGSSTGLIVKTKPQTKKPSLYRVLILNDDYTPMEFVVHILERFFSKSREEAVDIMLHIHKHGVGMCGVFTYEVAETKVTQVIDFARQHQHPLQCTMEKD